MPFEKKITDDLKAAMKAKDKLRVSCLRMLKASMKNKSVEKGDKLKDDEIQGIITSLIRKGKEASTEFRKAVREDLADKEDQEIKILVSYLPEQLTPDEIEHILKEIIAENNTEGSIRNDLLLENTLDFLYDNAKIKRTKSIPFEELIKEKVT